MVKGQAGRAVQLASELGSLPVEELLGVVPMLEDMIQNAAQFRKQSPAVHLMAIPLGVLGRLWPASRVVMGRRVCKTLHRELLTNTRDILLQHRVYTTGVVDKDRIYEDLIRLEGLGGNVQLEWWGMNKSLREREPEKSERGFQERDVLLGVMRAMSSDGSNSLSLPITRLDIQFEEPRKKDIESLISFMRTLPSLTELDLARNSLGEECLAALNLMGTNTTLRRIELWQNELGGSNPSTLGSFVAQFPALEFLGINRNGLSDEPLAGLLVSIPPSITHLDVSYNAIAVLGAEDLASKLPELPALRALDLSNNKLGDDGVAALAAALASSCSALTHLALASVASRDDAAATALGEALPRAPALAHLTLGGARGWGPAGMSKIWQGVAACKALSTLEIEDLREPDESIPGLCECLQALRRLEMRGCEIAAEDSSRLAHVLSAEGMLRRLELKGLS